MRRIISTQVLNPFGANNMTGTAIVTSNPIETYPFDLNEMSFEVQWTGTPTGTLTIEGSSQYDPVNNPGATFITISTSSLIFPLPVNPTGAPGSLLTLFARPGVSKWVRWRYVNTSGTGQLSIWAFGKGRN